MQVLKRAGVALAIALSLGAIGLSVSAFAEDLPPLPFPVERGSALPPPDAASAQPAPPEGASPGGLEFGQWRSANPAQYRQSFETQILARASGRNRESMRRDLEANGFRCDEGGGALDCRIEIVDRGCAFDWYVVRETATPIVGFDKLCLAQN